MKEQDRHTLRQQVLAKRDSLDQHARAGKSHTISERVMALPEVLDARLFLVYMHFRTEVETSELINLMFAANKTVTVPYTKKASHELTAVHVTDLSQQVVPGYCDIPEPLPELVATAFVDPKNIDVVIVPGSVFDRHGGRLGYGGGYYDRFFANASPASLRVGLAFEVQIVDRVPVEVHDKHMDFVVTEENLYDCRRDRYA